MMTKYRVNITYSYIRDEKEVDLWEDNAQANEIRTYTPEKTYHFYQPIIPGHEGETMYGNPGAQNDGNMPLLWENLSDAMETVRRIKAYNAYFHKSRAFLSMSLGEALEAGEPAKEGFELWSHDSYFASPQEAMLSQGILLASGREAFEGFDWLILPDTTGEERIRYKTVWLSNDIHIRSVDLMPVHVMTPREAHAAQVLKDEKEREAKQLMKDLERERLKRERSEHEKLRASAMKRADKRAINYKNGEAIKFMTSSSHQWYGQISSSHTHPRNVIGVISSSKGRKY